LKKRWKILNADPDKVIQLKKALGFKEAICRILVTRGFDSFESAKNYFRPQLAHLHDPMLMKDMDKAVARIGLAIEKKQQILVFGDYDVDGTTSVASMYSFLCELYDISLLHYYIPHRYREGYGVSKQGIDFAAEKGCKLIIAIDCGIKSADLISYAKTLGIDFIVCDHHLPDLILPDAVAILNSKQKDCLYPYKELCGCGVGFKLITALAHHYKLPEETYLRYLDLLATAIAADIVSMTGENRILTYYGLKKINSNPSVGIAALKEKAGLFKELTISNVVFMIAPRVNAAGRMDDAIKAVQLFIESDKEKADVLASILHSDNDDRKEADSSTTLEALEIINSDPELINRKSSVVYKEGWHKGVVGIVASRLIEHYYRPTVVLTKSGDVVAGSARSVTGFNLYEAIHACREYLLGYGGHFAAAGLSLLPENVEAFSNKFNEVVSATIDEKLLTPEIVIDSEILLEDINFSLFNILQQMEPFGPENMHPIFIAKGVINTGYSKILKEKHIRFVLKQGEAVCNGIGFNMAELFPLLEMNKPLDVVFKIEENEFNGNVNLQLKVIDLRLSSDLS